MEATKPHAREANSLVVAGQIRPLPRKLHLAMRYDFDLSSPTYALPRSILTAPSQEVKLFPNVMGRKAIEMTIVLRYHCCLFGLGWPMNIPGA